MKRLLPSIVGLVIIACQSDRPLTSHRGRVAADISDGSHCINDTGPCVLGNAHFFFLPPMVSQPSPTGTFNPNLAPTVTICQTNTAGVCIGPPFTLGPIQVDPTGQQYKVNWNTDPATVLVGQTYRIIVTASGVQLGFADVMPVSNGSQLKNLDTGEFIGLVDGRTLPIKFRVELGATCFARTECFEQTVGPNPSTRVDVQTPPTFLAGVSFPPGYLTQAVTLTIARVSDGCFAPSTPTPALTEFGCFSFTTSPQVDNPLNCTAQPGETPPTADDIAHCARVEVCPTIAPVDANYHDLRLYKSDPGTAAQQLQEATASLIIDCTPWSPPGELLLRKHGVIDLALRGWHSVVHAVGRLVLPQPAFGTTAMAHLGIGGMTCCFSNIGWGRTNVRFSSLQVSPTTLNIGGLEGTATVSLTKATEGSVSGLVVQGFIVQGSVRQLAGTSDPFTCASGTCTLPGFNFVANSGTLVCGSASAEFDLVQGGTLLQVSTIGITLSKINPDACP